MTEYVCGFAFSPDRSQVLLIRKARPAWQAGQLNGIGGHIEKTDMHPWLAMVREFREETGLSTNPNSWQEFAVLSGSDWTCYFFRIFDADILMAKTLTDEPIELVDAKILPDTVLPNLRWLIPLALDDNALMDYNVKVKLVR